MIGLLRLGGAAAILKDERSFCVVLNAIKPRLSLTLCNTVKVNVNCRDTGKRVFGEIGLSSCKVHLGKVSATECVVLNLNFLNVVINNAGHSRTVKECLNREVVNILNQSCGRKYGTISKCSVSNTETGNRSICKHNVGKLTTVFKSRSRYHSNCSAKLNGGKICTIHKYLTLGFTNVGNSSGNINNCKRITSIEELITKCVVLNTGVECYLSEAVTVLEYTGSRKIGDRFRNCSRYDTGVSIHILCELCNTLEVNDLSKSGTVLEQCNTNRGKVCSSIGNSYVNKRSTASKRTIADGLNTCGNNYVIKLFTTLKCVVADSFDCSGNDNGFKVLGILEAVIGNNCNICSCGNFKYLECRTCKCSAQNLMNGFRKSKALCSVSRRVVDKSKHILIEERAVHVNVALVAGIYREAGDCGTVREGVTCHIGQSRGKSNFLYLYTIFESELADIGKTDRERKCFNVTAVCKCASTDSTDSVGEYNTGKSVTSVECISTDRCKAGEANTGNSTVAERSGANGSNTGGKIDLGESNSSVECVFGNCCYLATFSKSNLCKRSTSAECRSTNGSNVCRNLNLVKRSTV